MPFLIYGPIAKQKGSAAPKEVHCLQERQGCISRVADARRNQFAGAAAALLTLWWIGPSSAERILVFAILTNLCVSTLSLALYLYTATFRDEVMEAEAAGTAARIASS